jgi:hypothetical protein
MAQQNGTKWLSVAQAVNSTRENGEMAGHEKKVKVSKLMLIKCDAP